MILSFSYFEVYFVAPASICYVLKTVVYLIFCSYQNRVRIYDREIWFCSYSLTVNSMDS